MNNKAILFIAVTLLILCAAVIQGSASDPIIIKNVYATAYYCPYNSEMDGTTLTITTVSGKIFEVKASLLFGGRGAAMQGTGCIIPGEVYIRYDGGGGRFLHINDEKEFTNKIKKRYADMGVDDFAGFGGLALSNPDKANFSIGQSIIGSSGRVLKPMRSIAVDPSVIPLGATGKLVFKSGTMPDGKTTEMYFSADDTGGGIDGRHIDIYLGEGNHALKRWYESGGNRYVTVRF